MVVHTSYLIFVSILAVSSKPRAQSPSFTHLPVPSADAWESASCVRSSLSPSTSIYLPSQILEKSNPKGKDLGQLAKCKVKMRKGSATRQISKFFFCQKMSEVKPKHLVLQLYITTRRLVQDHLASIHSKKVRGQSGTENMPTKTPLPANSFLNGIVVTSQTWSWTGSTDLFLAIQTMDGTDPFSIS